MNLTDRQISYVNRALALLSEPAQSQFRASVADLLAHAQHGLSDRDLLDALRPLLAQHGRSVGEVLPPWARNYANRQKGDHHANSPVF